MGDPPQPGFRFYPTEEELVSFYLHNRLEGIRVEAIDRVIPVLDIYEYNPWELPQFAGEYCGKDPEEWFFFIPMQEREARGGRPNRLTTEGYWKATGSPGYVYSSNNVRVRIGVKRTMVFYNGRAPNARKTQWKMNEYKYIEPPQADSSSSSRAPPKLRQELSICRVYIKSKTVRAFDRRPPPQEKEPSATPLVDHRPSSQGSSSSGDHALENDYAAHHTTTDHAVENGDWNFPEEPLLDWELMNCF